MKHKKKPLKNLKQTFKKTLKRNPPKNLQKKF